MQRSLLRSLVQRFAIVPALLVAAVGVRAAAINTGVEQILWPASIVAKPFVMVHDLLFGSDHDARQSAEREANKIFDAQQQPIPVNGLYTGPLNLRLALYGMLVEARLPFIEADTAGSAWLLALAKEPMPLISQAERSRYIRLSLGDQGDAHCFEWKSQADDWVSAPPVRPGTCLRLTFVDRLGSDVQLKVDASSLSHRKLRWVLTDSASGRTLLSVPFWESQIDGQPLRVSAVYRAAHETGTFISVLGKLSASVTPRTSDDLPFIMNRIKVDLRGEATVTSASLWGHVRTPTLDWDAIEAARLSNSWQSSYARARSTGKPEVIGTLLLVPQTDSVGSSCAFPYQRNCDFTASYVSDLGLMTTAYRKAFLDTDKSRNPHGHGSNMSVEVAARGFDGQPLWVISITPATLPSSHEACQDFSLFCYFYPSGFTLTAQELVVRGSFWRPQLPRKSDEYELVVQRTQLPAAAGR